MKHFLLFFVLFYCVEVSAQVTKVLISGLGNTTINTNIQTAFMSGYASHNGDVFSGMINTINDGVADASASFTQANSEGDQVIIRSTTGLVNAITTAGSYPGITLFMSAGSNAYQSEFTGDVSICPVIVTGAGTLHNATAYFVEFFGSDPISTNVPAYANAYVAGQLCFLSNHLGITVSQARAYARQYGKPTPLNTDGFYDGYGVINSAIIISSVLPVELTSFTAVVKDKNIELAWSTATEVNNYGFEIEKNILSSWSKIGFVGGNGTTNSPKEYSFSDKNVSSGKYFYRLKQIDRDGKFEYSEKVEVNVKNFPKEFLLSQNYPNPFNPATTINFSLPKTTFVILKVYDMLGREVSTLVNEEKSTGIHQVKFDGSSMSSGIYVYKISAGNFVQTKKMFLLK